MVEPYVIAGPLKIKLRNFGYASERVFPEPLPHHSTFSIPPQISAISRSESLQNNVN